MNVLIVGATSGIGLALAEEYLAAGHRVVLTGRRVELLGELCQRYASAAVAIRHDVTDTAMNVIAELAAPIGDLDLVILSAGWGHRNPELDFETEKKTIALNVLGFTKFVQDIYKYYLAKNLSGRLAVITSIASLRGSRFAPAYAASKAYQTNMIEGLRALARKQNVDLAFTDIRPGFVRTAMGSGPNLFWVSPPEKAARQIVAALRRGKDVVYVTRRWALIAGLLRLLPLWVQKRI